MKLEVATYMLTFCEIDTYQNLVVCIRIASEIIDEIENKLWNFVTFTNRQKSLADFQQRIVIGKFEVENEKSEESAEMRGNQLKMKNCATQDSLVDFGPVTNRVANNIIKSYNTRYLVGPPFCKNQPLPKQGKIISEDAILFWCICVFTKDIF